MVSCPESSCAVGSTPAGRPVPAQLVALEQPHSAATAAAAAEAETPTGAAALADQQPTPDSAYANRQSCQLLVNSCGRGS